MNYLAAKLDSYRLQAAVAPPQQADGVLTPKKEYGLH